MLSLEHAKDLGFQTSTVEELRAYCDQLGVKYDGRHKDKTLISLLCAELGIANSPYPEAKRTQVRIVSKSEVVPPYNLRPEGVWEGRRHRVRLMRPDGVKIAAGVWFSWNGKKFPIAYDEVTNVPEPFYNTLRETAKVVAKPRRIDLGDGDFEKDVDFVSGGEKYPHQYLGVDPETKDRCGSLKEWYQQKGPAWFRERSLRELGIIAGLIDVSTRSKRDEPLSQEDLCNALVEFFFSYADAEEAEAA